MSVGGRNLPILTKIQYVSEFLRELEEEHGASFVFSINAREEDIPEHYMGLEVDSGTLIDWCEDAIDELKQCVKGAQSEQVSALTALVQFVEAVAESNDVYA